MHKNNNWLPFKRVLHNLYSKHNLIIMLLVFVFSYSPISYAGGDMESNINMQYEYDDIDINTLMLLRAEEEKLNFAEIVLMPAITNIEDDSKVIELLYQEKKHYQEQVFIQQLKPVARTILIPVNLNKLHWTGLVIKLNENNQFLQAKYIDPFGSAVLDSDTPAEIKNWLKTVYGSAAYLENTTILRQTDKTSSGVLTIENLIRIALEKLDIEIAYEELTSSFREHHIYLLEQIKSEFKFNLKQANSTNSWAIEKIGNISLDTQYHDMKLYRLPATKLVSLFKDNLIIPNIILLGKVGSGKGTLSDMLVSKYDYVHVSIGDLIRSAAKENSDLGIKVRGFVEQNKIISAQVAAELLYAKLTSIIAERRHFILDNFPICVSHVPYLLAFLDKYKLGKNTIIIIPEISDEEVLSRLVNRRICPICAKSYNLKTLPPLQNGICDKCGVALIIRKDDATENVTQVRLPSYEQNTLPVIRLLEEKIDLYLINNIFDLFNKFVYLQVQQSSQTSNLLPPANSTSLPSDFESPVPLTPIVAAPTSPELSSSSIVQSSLLVQEEDQTH